MDHLACMRAFVTVVEGGGFSEAARRLGVSKVQISKQVGQLEDSLGVRLLHRTTRKVTPSSSGQAYFEQCRPLLDELDQLNASVQQSSASPGGELHITAPQTFAEMHLLPVVSDYVRDYPEVTVKLDLTDRFVDLVEERIDVAIRIGSLAESSLVARKLGDVTMRLCVAPDYLAEHSRPQQVQDLAQHRCILDSNYPGGKHWTLGQGKSAETVTVQTHLIVNSARAARDLIRAGHGIGLLPSFAVDEDIEQGRLIALLPDAMPESLGMYALYLSRKHLSAKVRVLVDRLVERFVVA